MVSKDLEDLGAVSGSHLARPGASLSLERLGLRFAAALAGRPLPRPTFVPQQEPLPIVEWLAGELHQKRTPYLLTTPSPAVAVCERALRAGLDLHGAQTALGTTAGPERIMAMPWRQAGLLQPERRPPLMTPTGKIQHLHASRLVRSD